MAWREAQPSLTPRRLVFIDETWIKTNMARTHARALRGQRAIGAVPHGHWQTSTFLAALRCDRLTAPCVIDGPINGLTFQAYVDQILVPTLARGDIVIIDNLGSHKGRAVRQAIERVGATLLYLPPYSPDLKSKAPLSLVRLIANDWSSIRWLILINSRRGYRSRLNLCDGLLPQGASPSIGIGFAAASMSVAKWS